MAQLLNWFNNAGKAAGQALDRVVPGDQSRMWQSEQERKRQQQQQQARNVQVRPQAPQQQPLQVTRANPTSQVRAPIARPQQFRAPAQTNIARQFVNYLPQAAGEFNEGVGQNVQAIFHAIPRGIKSLGLDQRGQSSYTAKNILEQGLYGKTPVVNSQEVGRQIINSGGSLAGKPNLANNVPKVVQAGLGVASNVADAFPAAVLGKQGIEAGAKGVVNSVASTKGRVLQNVAKQADEINLRQELFMNPTKKLNPERVQKYADDYLNDRPVDPVIITRQADGYPRIIDGEHRMAALRSLGADYIPTKTISQRQADMALQGGYIAGPGAKGFKEAEEAGRVFDGVDGKPRFEVTDNEARLVSIGSASDKLDKLLDHPTLYKNYPQLRNADVDIKIDKNRTGAPVATYSNGRISIFAKNHSQAKSKLLHEVQHGIQEIEDFSKGTNPRSAGGFDNYHKSAGEVEARAVEARRNMTDEERYLPGKEYYHGTPHADQIKKEGFSLDHTGKTSGSQGVYGKGVYFTPDKQYANEYGELITVRPADDARIRIFTDVDDHQKEIFSRDTNYGDPNLISEKFKKLGYDGIELRGKNGGGELVIFDPEKVEIGPAKPRSTFDDSMDVPKEQQIVNKKTEEVVNSASSDYYDVYRGQDGDTFSTKNSAGLGRSFTTDESIAKGYANGVGDPFLLKGKVSKKDVLHFDDLKPEDQSYVNMIVDDAAPLIQKEFGSGNTVEAERLMFDLGEIAQRYGKKAVDIDSMGLKDPILPGANKEIRVIDESAIAGLSKNRPDQESALLKKADDARLQMGKLLDKANATDDTYTAPLNKLHANTTDELSEAMSNIKAGKSSRSTGPIEVTRTPAGKLVVIEGHHRVVQALERGDSDITVKYVPYETKFNDQFDYGVSSIVKPDAGIPFVSAKETSLDSQLAKVDAQRDKLKAAIGKLADQAEAAKGDRLLVDRYHRQADKLAVKLDLLDDKEIGIRREAQDSGVAMSIEPEYKPSKTIKKAEDDYATGKITGDELEAIRQAEASKATATPEKAQRQARSQASEAEVSPQIADNATSKVKLNTNRLDVNDEARARLDTETAEVIERLTNQEVKDLAKSAGIDMKSYGVAGTKKKIAEQLNLRNEISTVEKEIAAAKAAGDNDQVVELMKKSADLGRLSREQGTDLGRQLAARRIIADQLATPQQKLFRLFDEAGVDPDVYTKRLADLDMSNADEVVKAYRDLVPASASDWLDKYRYTNMLSSPLTHIVNITSNASGVFGVAPAQKLAEGAVDAAKSALTGSQRTRYASEAGAYMKGAANNVPEGIQKFKDVMTGKQMMDMPDADALKYGKLAHGGAAGVADTVLSFIPKLLEASDQLGMTITKGGEKAALLHRQSKGIKLRGDIDGMVDDAAKYRVFRQELGKKGQGYILESIDAIPLTLLEWRRSKNPIVQTTAKFTVPFVTTPVNLFKQGFEYGPSGILTIPGSADKTAQAAKALMGTTVTALAVGALAGEDRITFSEPTNAKQRDAFRAEGKQPYAIKIGDKWFGYSKLHPAISFNLAVVGAVKDARDKGSIDESTADKILNAAGGVLGYFRDQSYMKSVGDFTSNLELKDGAQLEDAFASMASNWGNQLSPFKSMVSWVGRQVDPTQRKTDYTASSPQQIYQNLVKDIPGLNANVPTRKNPYTGEAIKNDNPLLNAWSPVRVTNDRGFGNTTGLNQDQREMLRDLPADQREVFRRGIIEEKFATAKTKTEKETFKKKTESSDDQIAKLSDGKAYAKIGDDYKTYDSEDLAKQAIAKAKFKTSNAKSQVIGDNFYYRTPDGTVKSKPVAVHEEEKAQVELDNAKDKGDLATWNKAADKKMKALEKQLKKYDKDTQAKQHNAIVNKIQKLQSDKAKYGGYAGFYKPKSTSTRRASSGSTRSRSTGRARAVFKAPRSGGISQIGKTRDLRKLITGSKVVRRKIT